MSKNIKSKMDKDQKGYLTSKEAMSSLKVSSCDLMHLRTSGKIKFVKKGNAYLYEKGIIKNLKK